MKLTDNKFELMIGSTKVAGIIEENWVEFNFRLKSGYWFRKFVSKAGYTTPDEIPEVAKELLRTNYEEYKKRKEGA